MFLAVFGILFLITAPSSMYMGGASSSSGAGGTNKNTTVRKVRTNKKYKNDAPELFDPISEQCDIPPLREPTDNKIGSAFLSSYPGSGSRLQRLVVEAMTGIVTTDDTFSNGRHNVIAIQTHYPCPVGREFPGAQDIFKAIVFVRHPMDALPSYYNEIYASEKGGGLDIGIPAATADVAPLQDWIAWRDIAFARELETWRKHFSYWMDRYSRLNRLVVPYEQLVSRKYGPDLVIEMAAFLRQGNNAITTVEPEELPCIWQTIVKQGGGDTSVRRRLQLLQNPSQKLQVPPSQLLQQQQQEDVRQQQQDVQQQQQDVQQQQQDVQQQQQDVQQQANDMQTIGANTMADAIAAAEAKQQQQQSSTMQSSLDTNQTPETVIDQEETTTTAQQQVPLQASAMQMLGMNKITGGNSRVGDDTQRPFTEHQRKEIVITLTQLLEIYRDDRILAPLLVGYIDQVAKLHEEEARRRQLGLD